MLSVDMMQVHRAHALAVLVSVSLLWISLLALLIWVRSSEWLTGRLSEYSNRRMLYPKVSKNPQSVQKINKRFYSKLGY